MWAILMVLALVLLVAGIYNQLVRLRNMAEEGFSTMDVYLKKRYDLIPNLVETVKAYANHEKETLEAVIAARNKTHQMSNTDDKLAAEGQLSQVLGRLFALSESYPELKANRNFMDLQNQLKSIETEISQARKYYNALVRDYNIKCESFPSVIIANLFGFEKKSLFVIEDEAERQSVKVQF